MITFGQGTQNTHVQFQLGQLSLVASLGTYIHKGGEVIYHY